MKVILDDSQEITLGVTEATPTVSLVDYSRRETDDFGVTTVVKRGFARRLSARLIVPFEQTGTVQRQLAALRAQPVQWVADSRFAWLNFRGFFRDFEIDLAMPPKSYCTLQVEGLAETETAADPGTDPAPAGSVSSLQVIVPATIDSSALISSSLAFNDHAQWSSSVTYATGARVIKTGSQRIWQSAGDDNTGNDPEGDSGLWFDVGPANRWAMFDNAIGSASTAAGSIQVSLSVGQCNALALLDVVASSVRVQVGSYGETRAPDASGAVNFLDLPLSSSTITVIISGPGAVEVGTLTVGRLRPLGVTLDSPKASITDFSVKEADEFGEFDVVERAWAKRVSLRAKIQTSALDIVANRIAALRAVPCLWIGKNGLDPVTVFGFFKDFSIAIDTQLSELSLTLEGLSSAGKVEPLAASTDWPDVGDPDGTKPEDNATAGAPAGTLVAGREAGELVDAFDRFDTALQIAQSDVSAMESAIVSIQSDFAAQQVLMNAQAASLLAAQADILAAGENIEAIETTLGSHGATISTLQTTASNHAGQLSTLSTTVSTQGSTVSSHATAISTLQGNYASLSSTVSAQGATVSSHATAISTLQGNYASLSSTVSAQGATVSSHASAISNLEGIVASLTIGASSANPNLLSNGGFERGATGWTSNVSGWSFGTGTWGRVASNTYNPANGNEAQLTSEAIPVEVGEKYTCAADCAYFLSSGTGYSRILLVWYNSSGTQLSVATGPELAASHNFANDLANRAALKVTGTAPANAATVRVLLVMRKTTGTVGPYGYAWRQVKLERGEAATGFSNEAAVTQAFNAISTAQGDLATLSSTVGTQGSTVSSHASALTTLQNNYASLSSTVSTQGSTVSNHASAISNLQGNYSSLSSTVSTQGSTVSSHALAISDLQGETAALVNQVATGNPNLLKNGGFENGIEGWTSNIAGWSVNNGAWGRYLSHNYNMANGAEAQLTSKAIPVEVGEKYTCTADFALFMSSGTGYSRLTFTWHDASGAQLSSISGPQVPASHNFANDQTNRNALKLTAPAPANAATMKVWLIVHKNTGSIDSYGYAWRQVKLERGEVATAYSSDASIVESFTVLNGLRAKWGVEIDVSGYVTGIALNNDGERSDFTIRADKFGIISPGGGARTEYSGGNWRAYYASGNLAMRWGVW